MSYYYDYFPYASSIPIPFPYPPPAQKTEPAHHPDEVKQEPGIDEPKIEQADISYLKSNEPEVKLEEEAIERKPASRKAQKDSFTEKRNIVPNNINHILAFVQRKSKSEAIVQSLIQKYKGQNKYTPKRFYVYQGQLKEKLHVHVNKDSLNLLMSHLDQKSEIFTLQEQELYNRISRILIFYYLREKARLTLLSSGRVKQTNKKDHLLAQRELLEYVSTHQPQK